MQRLLFELRYLIGKPPWDSGITPPEVIQYIRKTPPGRALDLGCGTGTSSIELSRHGWQVTGVDQSFTAIRRAKRKARQCNVIVDFRVESITNLFRLSDIGRFDLVLDIGCFHSLNEETMLTYSEGVKGVTRGNGCLLMYGFFETVEFERDILPLFRPEFQLVEISPGNDSAIGRPSAWITLTREGS